MNDDLNFDFDFGTDNFFSSKEKFVEIDICGLVKKMKSKKRHFLNIGRETKQLNALLKNPPQKNECFKMLSVGGGFSSLAIINFIAELEKIEVLYCSTFRIGKNHFSKICSLKEQCKIDKCFFLTSQTQERADEKMKYKGTEYNYFKFICDKCEEYGWKIKSFDNHSKLILMKTKENFYVVETSSNLNENPKMEQFSFENDKELYEWYEGLFLELLKK